MMNTGTTSSAWAKYRGRRTKMKIRRNPEELDSLYSDIYLQEQAYLYKVSVYRYSGVREFPPIEKSAICLYYRVIRELILIS